jgi:hypothetical protein
MNRILIQVPSNTKRVGGCRLGNVSSGVIQCDQTRGCDSTSTAGRDRCRYERAEVLDFRQRLDLRLQEARRPHSSHRSKVRGRSDDIDVLVKDVGQAVAQCSDDRFRGVGVLVDVVFVA